VLSTRDAAERALAWPPVRADLTEMSSRWDLLAGRAGDDYHRASAGQAGAMVQDLVTAVDQENQAVATGRDWTMLSPRVDEIVRALDGALIGFVVAQTDPNADPGSGADPGDGTYPDGSRYPGGGAYPGPAQPRGPYPGPAQPGGGTYPGPGDDPGDGSGPSPYPA
jgi:hypothetical protein